MRPINLIPEEDRRRTGGVATRTGPVVYLLVGALGVLLIGVVMLVLFSNSVHDRESEVARLESEKAVATAQASKLAGYTSFKQVAEQRTQTIAELADSRFDWVRVIHQLSLVLPGDVYFEGLAASAGGSAEGGVKGPALSLTGCGAGQSAVAGFVASLREIDGVTRVQLGQSTVNAGGKEGEETKGGGSPCSKPGMARFEILVAFDAAPASPDSAVGMAEAGEAASESEGTSESEGSSEGESEGSEEGEGSSESGSEGESSTSQSAAVSNPGAAG